MRSAIKLLVKPANSEAYIPLASRLRKIITDEAEIRDAMHTRPRQQKPILIRTILIALRSEYQRAG